MKRLSMKILSRWIIWITMPIVIIMIAVSLLTSKPYLLLSKGYYNTHDNLYFDYDYAVERIIGYLNYRYDDLYFGATENDDSIIMRDTEISHMADVKNVYTGLRVFASVAFIFLLSAILYLRKKDRVYLHETIKKTYKAPLLVMFFLGVVMIVDFDTTFTIFHKIFFRNSDWLLYADDVLILLVPQTFWFISGLLVLLFSFLMFYLVYIINDKANKSAK